MLLNPLDDIINLTARFVLYRVLLVVLGHPEDGRVTADGKSRRIIVGGSVCRLMTMVGCIKVVLQYIYI